MAQHPHPKANAANFSPAATAKTASAYTTAISCQRGRREVAISFSEPSGVLGDGAIKRHV